MRTLRPVLALVVIVPVLLAACSKPEAGVGGDAAAPQAGHAPDAASPVTADAATPAVTAAVSSPKPPDPAVVKVTGKLRYQPSWNYIPGLKDPSGKGSAGFEVFIGDVAIDAAPGAKALRDVVRFAESPLTMSSPNVGSCKSWLTTNDTADVFSVWAQEPGCDPYKLYSGGPLKVPFTGVAKGKLVSSGKPVDVHFDLKAADPPPAKPAPSKK